MHDVLTVGTATIDTFIEADFLKTVKDKEHLSRIGFITGQAQCFSLGSKIEISQPIIEIGGGAHNAAVTFSRAGLKTASLFNVGDDKEGETVVEEFVRKGIRPFGIVDDGRKTGVAYILLNKDGERTILVYRGCSGAIENSEIPFGKLRAGWVYIAPGSIPYPVLKKLFAHFEKTGARIAINPSKDLISLGIGKIKPFLNLASVVILNKEEGSYLTRISFDKTAAIFAKFDKYVPGIVVMTDGKKGATISDGRTFYKSGVFREGKIIDKTGAGDAFGSGFVAGLIETNEQCHKGLCNPRKIEYALKRGAANATSVIEKIGATPGILTKEEFNNRKRWKDFPVIVRKINF
jgi:ribokinase